MASSSWELAMATSSTYQTAATYAQWQRDYAEHESRMQNQFRRKTPRTDDMNTWTLDEIDEWANKSPPNETMDAENVVVPSANSTDSKDRQLDLYRCLHFHWRRHIQDYVLPGMQNDCQDEKYRQVLEFIR